MTFPHPVTPELRTHQADTLVSLFNHEFSKDFSVVLQGGGAEPLYQPASTCGGTAQISFTRDYFASALHEVAHWCIAGPERRQREDYGYWYQPDGRNQAQQQLFERVEVKPQALEWVFATAAGYPFRVSADNLAVGEGPSDRFKRHIWQQVQLYCSRGLPSRAHRFARALSGHYGTDDPLVSHRYRLEAL